MDTEPETDITPAEGQRDTRAWQAFELRRAGASYEQVARAVGYKNAGTAESAVRRVMRQAYSADAEDMLTLELARLDAMMMVLWPKVKDGSFQAIDRVLRIMQQRQQYVPALAPKGGNQTNVAVAGGVTISVSGSEDDYVAGLEQARAELEKAEEERRARLGMGEVIDAEVIEDEDEG